MLTKIIKMCGCSTKVQGASQDRAWIYWKFKHLSFRRRLFHSFVTIKYHVSSGMSQNIQENSTGKTLGFTCKNRVTWSNRVKSCVHYLKHLHKKKGASICDRLLLHFSFVLSAWCKQNRHKKNWSGLQGQKVEDLETSSLCKAYCMLLYNHPNVLSQI